MITGDHVRLHIDPGHRAVLNLPDCIGIVQAIDVKTGQISLLVHFDTMSVYVSPISPTEVEIVDVLSPGSSATQY